jgi:hypothetical protein
MKNFRPVSTGVNVSALALELQRQPDLWNRNPSRLGSKGPHRETDDIFLRYKDERPHIASDDWRTYSDPHIPMWYSAFDRLPGAHSIIFTLAAMTRAEMIGGVFIYRMSPGTRIYPHKDPGWHPSFYDKFNVCIESNDGAAFRYPEDEESMVQRPGDIHWFRNDTLHEVVNRGDTDHIVMTVCLRCDRGERVPASPEGWTMDESMRRWHEKQAQKE